jgi:hypothetical protein
MPKANPSTLFVECLRNLLSQRQALRPLLTRYRTYLDQRQYNAARTSLEQEITAAVSAGLPFNEKERRYNLPQAEHLAVAAYNLRIAFNRPELQENPKLVWDYGCAVPGVLTTGWHPAVKARLITLVGPLDYTLEQMLSA